MPGHVPGILYQMNCARHPSLPRAVFLLLGGASAMTTLVTFLGALVVSGAVLYATYCLARLAAHCVLWTVRSMGPRAPKHRTAAAALPRTYLLSHEDQACSGRLHHPGPADCGFKTAVVRIGFMRSSMTGTD